MFDKPAEKGTSLFHSPASSCNRSIMVLVLGLGNVLLKDEGVGVHVAEKLQKLNLPCSVEVVDGGTSSLDVLLSAQGIEKLVVIDALRAGQKAGTVYKAKFSSGEQGKMQQIFSSGSKISLHQVGLIDTLAVAERMHCAPKEIVIIGVEPKEVDYGLELTEKVKQCVPEIINEVLKEIENAIHTK